MGPIGTPELIVIGILALIVFGPKRLPEIGRNVGAALREFRKASRDIISHFEEDEPPPVRTVSRAVYDGDSHPGQTSEPVHDTLPATSERKEGHAA